MVEEREGLEVTANAQQWRAEKFFSQAKVKHVILEFFLSERCKFFLFMVFRIPLLRDKPEVRGCRGCVTDLSILSFA